MSDGECLSWVCSIFHHVREEVVFGDIWKDESEVALFLSQIYSYIYAVDVIHFAFLLFQHLVDDQLYGSCSNGLLTFLYIVDDELVAGDQTEVLARSIGLFQKLFLILDLFLCE